MEARGDRAGGRLALAVVALLAFAAAVEAEEISDAAWGFSFEAPAGWALLQKGAEGALLAAADGSGFLLVEPHALGSRDELAAAAAEGYQDEGIYLVPTEPVKPFGDGHVAVLMQGIIDGVQARAYGVGLVSPHGGGAVVFGAAAPEKWDPAAVARVERVARSVRFAVPQASPAAAGWKQKLSGRCVAYLSSSGSSGGSYGGYSTGSYTSDKARYYLYPDGSFEGSSSSFSSFDTGGGFGSMSGGSGPQRGSWSIGSLRGQATLDLRRPDGSTIRYGLSTNERGHTFLDGDRWFVVSYEECHDL